MRNVYLSRRLHEKILGEKNKWLYFRKYGPHLTQILHINCNYPCEALAICIFPNRFDKIDVNAWSKKYAGCVELS